MTFTKAPSRLSRLTSLIEVEVSLPSAPSVIHTHTLHGFKEEDPLKALEELAEKMEKLEQSASDSSSKDPLHQHDRDEAAKAIFEMQRRLEHFQKQCTVLKRLMNKLN